MDGVEGGVTCLAEQLKAIDDNVKLLGQMAPTQLKHREGRVPQLIRTQRLWLEGDQLKS